MKGAESFIDTNVLVYLVSGNASRAHRAEEIVAAGGVVSVQVLNEVASVASRKLRFTVAEIRELTTVIRAACRVVALSEETHDLGMEFAERHSLSIYDAMILASAQLAGCAVVLSENLQDGQRLSSLRIRNPFR